MRKEEAVVVAVRVTITAFIMENNKKKNKYNAASHEGEFASLRIPVDYTRAGILDDIQDSYALLVSKGRGKTQFIVNAILSESKAPRRLSPIEELAYEARKLDAIRVNHGLETIEDFINFFENPSCIEALALSVAKYGKKPTKMTLGFNRNSEEAKTVYDMLGNEAPRERVTIISNAVLSYTKKGKDLAALAILADRTLLDTASAYNTLTGNDRDEFINNFQIFLKETQRLYSQKKDFDSEKTNSTAEIEMYFR